MVVGRMLEQIFIRCYAVIKMNVIFVGLMFGGGIVLGIGPAWLTITNLAYEFEFDTKEITWRVAWRFYKENFKRGNALFYLFAGCASILLYSLYAAVQVKGIFFLITSCVLISAIVLATVCFILALVTDSRYQTSFRNILKLTLLVFFTNFFTIIKLLAGILVVAVITYKSPALLLFGTASLLVIYVLFITKGIYQQMNAKFGME
ncbi:YesL family protein [Listeria grayi]|uniref:YesL family protein n=1 Tax=Listeria grayi TaxID=1641 RepID=UPI0016253973|nr:DUF624 domain-containing protein [Listeria grayi]MBC1921509.1 DUF624 domain-containing protein [Listeria grayi]